jgi:hypothetical protein
MLMPGFVQNWPAPIVQDVASSLAMLEPRSRRAPGRMNIGFTADSSR